VKLTSHLHLVLRWKMRGAISPLPQHVFMVWCSVKAQKQLYLYLYLTNVHLKTETDPVSETLCLKTLYEDKVQKLGITNCLSF
jgi:hypothetical protein